MTFKWILMALLVGLLTSGAEAQTTQPAPIASAQPAPPPAAPIPAAIKAKLPVRPIGRGMQVVAIDKETGAPLEFSKITVFVNEKKTNTSTGPLGDYFIRLPETGLQTLKFHARADGYVPTMMYWQSMGKELNVPEEYVMAVEKGTTLSGVIRDETGNPVVGVGVMFYPQWFWGEPNQERPNYIHNSFKTDATGRWTSNIAPSNPPMPLRIYLHPPPQGYERKELYKNVPIEEFREGTAEDVMKRLAPTSQPN